MSASREDAVAVYRWLQATAGEGGATLDEAVFQCFPVPAPRGDSAYKALNARSVRRVLDAIVWLRAQGVTVRAVPDPLGPTRYVVVG